MLTLIVARAKNGAIGLDNTIPWHVPEDLAFFKTETLGGAIIMGRNTWDSLPFKPLKNRLNIVVSSNHNIAENVCSTPTDAIDMAYSHGIRRVYGIGGQGIYSAMLPLAQRLLITEVDTTIEGADTFFPEFDQRNWNRIGSSLLDNSDPACRIDEYMRNHTLD
ncbi:dihydrofolate reductase [Amylibacter marinus]|uniref:Dihydrofolate reductase n=1 Tax=Amylibacter marinus TaxID=1475483 RepID=A0ABQ5VV83_9RHOB|nr:dihydrofolate reductase [Amylibacter marinus]GLQ35341.1 dihydrofolate reductase [Amylibacter marinus]